MRPEQGKQDQPVLIRSVGPASRPGARISDDSRPASVAKAGCPQIVECRSAKCPDRRSGGRSAVTDVRWPDFVAKVEIHAGDGGRTPATAASRRIAGWQIFPCHPRP